MISSARRRLLFPIMGIAGNSMTGTTGATWPRRRRPPTNPRPWKRPARPIRVVILRGSTDHDPHRTEPMKLPDGRPLIASDGVIPEPSAAEGRIILWLRGDRLGGHQHWERVSSVVRAGVAAGRGIRAIEAASIPARQWVGGAIGKLLRRRGVAGADRTWTLPDGTSAVQSGPRRTDLVLAWGEDDADPIDEARIRARWENVSGVKSIGVGLYLISGVEPTGPRARTGRDSTRRRKTRRGNSPSGRWSPPERAEDGPREMTALADLGLACLKEGDVPRAEGLLGEALAAARRLGDGPAELGVMIDLGLAALASGRPDRARQILGPLAARARAVGDRPAEKLALDRLGEAHSSQGDHAGALAHFERALAIASGLGDGRHEADLLWRIAIEHDGLGRTRHGRRPRPGGRQPHATPRPPPGRLVCPSPGRVPVRPIRSPALGSRPDGRPVARGTWGSPSTRVPSRPIPARDRRRAPARSGWPSPPRGRWRSSSGRGSGRWPPRSIGGGSRLHSPASITPACGAASAAASPPRRPAWRMNDARSVDGDLDRARLRSISRVVVEREFAIRGRSGARTGGKKFESARTNACAIGGLQGVEPSRFSIALNLSYISQNYRKTLIKSPAAGKNLLPSDRSPLNLPASVSRPRGIARSIAPGGASSPRPSRVDSPTPVRGRLVRRSRDRG